MAESNVMLREHQLRMRKETMNETKYKRQVTFSYMKMHMCNKACAANLNSNKPRGPQHACNCASVNDNAIYQQK